MSLQVAPDFTVDCKGFGVLVNGILISDADFCDVVMYFMTNLDVDIPDARFDLKDRIESLTLVEGFNGPRSRRFAKGA